MLNFPALVAILFPAVFTVAGSLRVVLDTDLGDDIDDTWALSLLLQARLM